MTAEGFSGLTSEWWHFQDDETRKKVSPARGETGVSAEGYKVDDRGIRYRHADGSYACDETIEGRYFDKNG